MTNAPQDLTVLHADDHVVAIVKPAGLLSVPGRGPERADCAVRRVQAVYADALTVHRLDMGTSGILLFARGLDAQRAMSLAFEKRRVAKRYVARVAGWPAEESGVVELPLVCDWPNRPRQIVDHAIGRPATTRWSVMAREGAASAGARTTRMALEPITGRSHQLRVHMQAIGHPILGDELYAPSDVEALARRLLLHAESLTLPHPASGLPLSLHAPCPF